MFNAECSIAAITIQERLQSAAQFCREVLVTYGAEERNRGLVGFELRQAPRALREVCFEVGVDLGRELSLDEVRQKAHEPGTPLHPFYLTATFPLHLFSAELNSSSAVFTVSHQKS